MMGSNHWHYKNEEVKEPLLYTACGLDDIYLLSGYEVRQTPDGETVTIKNLDGLHEAIGRFLVNQKKLLNGKEIRFLRRQMDLTQSEMARLFGCDAQQIARYEKNENKMPGPADRLLRMIYQEHVNRSIQVLELLHAIDELDSKLRDKKVFEETPTGWRKAAA